MGWFVDKRTFPWGIDSFLDRMKGTMTNGKPVGGKIFTKEIGD